MEKASNAHLSGRFSERSYVVYEIESAEDKYFPLWSSLQFFQVSFEKESEATEESTTFQ